MKQYELQGAAAAIWETLRSPNESDTNLEPANVVDGLFFIGRAINRLAEAVENHDQQFYISRAINRLAEAVEHHDQQLPT